MINSLMRARQSEILAWNATFPSPRCDAETTGGSKNALACGIICDFNEVGYKIAIVTLLLFGWCIW